MQLTESLLTFTRDLRYAARQLRRTPLFALVAIGTLALGIGANTAVFSVMNAVVLRYLPVPNPQQLVLLHYTRQPSNTSQTGYDDTSLPENVFEALRAQHDVFSDLVAFVPLSISKLPVRYGRDPEEATADEVSGNFFSGLGVSLIHGHGFTLDDEKQHAPIVVLGYGYWTRRFARNPSVLGQTIYLKGYPFTIVGVAAPEFTGVERDRATDLWVPFQRNPDLKPWGHSAADKSSMYDNPEWFFLMEIGRLQSGVKLGRAQAQVLPIYQHTVYSAVGQPEKNEPLTELRLTPARGIEGEKENLKPLIVLMVMVALVLLIACANVAMLLGARNAAREREFSLRIALGATRRMFFRQLLSESLLLVIAGGVLGWGFAVVATRTLGRWSEIEVSLAPDRQVLLFTFALSAAAALVFGLAPLRAVMRAPSGMAVKTGAAGSWQDRSRMRLGKTLVALQISLCLMLLVGAGLLMRTLRNLENADLGMNVSGLAVFGVTPPQWTETTLQGAIKRPEAPVGRASIDHDALSFYRTLLDRLRNSPGVESVTIMDNRIGSGWSNNTGVKVDGAVPGGKKFAVVRWNAVGPDYFHVLEVALLLGRDFTGSDTPDAPLVGIVNQTFAKQYLAGENPIGHHFELSGLGSAQGKAREFAIIGVVADSRYTGVREGPRPMAYLPYTQVGNIGTMHIELRTSGDPDALLPDVRRVVRDFGPDIPLLQPMTQREQFATTFNQERLFARLSVFFGLLAVLLVATGLYGALAYRVSRRTAEIGVRMAIGAKPAQVLWLVLRESLVICAAGALIGLPAALACSRLLRTMLFGLSASDPASFAFAAAAVITIALFASAVPAMRASSVDPMVALRCE